MKCVDDKTVRKLKNNYSTYVTKPTLSVILLNIGDSEIDSLTMSVPSTNTGQIQFTRTPSFWAVAYHEQ